MTFLFFWLKCKTNPLSFTIFHFSPWILSFQLSKFHSFPIKSPVNLLLISAINLPKRHRFRPFFFFLFFFFFFFLLPKANHSLFLISFSFLIIFWFRQFHKHLVQWLKTVSSRSTIASPSQTPRQTHFPSRLG